MLKRELQEHAQELHIELDEANERLSRIWELHKSYPEKNYEICLVCLTKYPCETVKAFFLCDCCGHDAQD